MTNSSGDVLQIRAIENRSIVSLRVSRNALDQARARFQLAEAPGVAGVDPQALPLGPDRWLLVSDSRSTAVLLESCSQALTGVTHIALDYSSALVVLSIAGSNARLLLATGTGIDLRPDHFPVDSCCRTRLAQIPVVIVTRFPDAFDVYVDRSYNDYLRDWLEESIRVLMKADYEL